MKDPDAWRAGYDDWKTTEPERSDEEDKIDWAELCNECIECGCPIPPREDYCFDCHRRGYG